MSTHVPRLLINRELTGMATLPYIGFDTTGQYADYRRDAVWLGDCDDGVEELCDLLGWKVM